MHTETTSPMRFPRIDVQNALEEIPKLDLSTIKDSSPLIKDFVVESSLQFSYGKFGTRKTTIHLLAAWAVSQGAPFLGRDSQHRMVLYLDYENPQGALKTYCEDLGLNPSHPFFTIWDRTQSPPPVPGDKRLQDFVDRCTRATGFAPWFIFDSWTSLLREGQSGNEIGHATPIFRAIRLLCDMGATVTVIDHSGKRGGKEPIGTSAKMTQMDSAHFFSVQSDELALDKKSSRTVIRVESYLKRYAPKSIGTFSVEVKAALDDQGIWHTLSVMPTKDISELQVEQQIKALKALIRKYGPQGQEKIAEIAMEEEIMTRNLARRLLQEGIGKYWKTKRVGRNQPLIFRVLNDE
jgi:AAA domain